MVTESKGQTGFGPFGFAEAPRIPESLSDFAQKLREAQTGQEKVALLYYLKENPYFSYGEGLSERSDQRKWEAAERSYRESFMGFCLAICQEGITNGKADEEILEPAVYCLLHGSLKYDLGTDPRSQTTHLIDRRDLYLRVVDFLARPELYEVFALREGELRQPIRTFLWASFRSTPWCERGKERDVPESWFDAVIRSGNADLFLDGYFVERWGAYGKMAVAKLAEAIQMAEDPLVCMLVLTQILHEEKQLRDFLAEMRDTQVKAPFSHAVLVGSKPFQGIID